MNLYPDMERACLAARHVRQSSEQLLLRPYQIEGIAHCQYINTLLHLEMGCGKTPTAAALARGLPVVVIIIPRVARAVWLKDLYRFGGVTSLIALEGKRRLRASRFHLGPGGVFHEEAIAGPVDHGVFLLTHESVGSWADTLPAQGKVQMLVNRFDAPPVTLPDCFDLVVVDESHRLGEKGSKRSMGSGKFAALADRLVLLSGTPDMGGTHRLWYQLHLLAGNSFRDYISFIKYFCGAEETDYGLKPGPGQHLDELKALMEPWVLSYRQAEVLPYLPKNTRDRITVPLTGDMARKLGKKLEAARKALKKLGECEADRASWFLPGEVTEARKACAEAKAPTVAEEALQLSRSGERVVVWSWHKEACRQVADLCRQGGAKVHVVTGDMTNSDVVDSHIEAWASTPAAVLCATIAKLGEGEDRLTAAHWQLFLEVDWLPQTLRQTERRLVRLSQTHPVNTRFFELELPFERSLMDRVLSRAGETDSLFGGTDYVDIGELFGVKRTGNTAEVLRRLSERLG